MNQEQKTEKTDDLRAFRKRLVGLAGERRYKQAEIAERLSISPSRVGSWFQGKNKPRGDIALHLAKLLRVSEEWLLNGTENTDYMDPGHALHEPGVMESSLPPAISLTQEEHARLHLENLLRAAQGDPARLGWISEQLAQHLRVPPHWTSGAGHPHAGRSEGFRAGYDEARRNDLERQRATSSGKKMA